MWFRDFCVCLRRSTAGTKLSSRRWRLRSGQPPTSKEDRMSNHVNRHNRLISSELHPAVYFSMLGLAFWFVISVWIFFAAEGYADYLFGVVSLFFLISLGIPVILWRVWRGQQNPEDHPGKEPFREWASCDFETWQCRLKGSHAAVEALLPIAAVAFGMTIFGIILHLTPHSVH
jgi:hypothetical protein